MKTNNVKGFFTRAYDTIKGHFLLRNIVLAVCFTIVGVGIVSLLLNLYTRHGQRYEVPDLMGSTVDSAQMVAHRSGSLELVVIDSIYMPKFRPGTIIDQSPKVGSSVKSGRKVFITINAMNPKMEVVPYVTGFSLRQAKNMLEGKGFEIDKLVYRNDLANNNVLSQSVGGKVIGDGQNLKVPLSSKVTLVVGRNNDTPMPVTPKVVGLSLRQAKSRLWEIGLNVGEIKVDGDISAGNMDGAKVYRQNPNQLTRADYGSRVTLWVTDDNSKIVDGSRKSDQATFETPEAQIEDVLDYSMIEE